jgi:hypothetical protein
VVLGVNDFEASKNLYDAVFRTLGVGPDDANKTKYRYRSKGA